MSDKRRARPRMVTLRPGDPAPSGTPTRHMATNGYVVLIWPQRDGVVIRCYEHRFVMGNPEGVVPEAEA